MAERGEIRNRKFANQVRDFKGMRWRNITPTDIDGFCDFGNELFVFIEWKFGDTQMPSGQALALERLCGACRKAGIPSYVLLAHHQDAGDIDCANAECIDYYGNEWHKLKQSQTVKELIDYLIRKHGKDK